MAPIYCPIWEGAQRSPNGLAVVGPDGQYSYDKMNQLVSTVSGNLARFGIKVGDKVGFIATPTVDTVALCFACFRLGAIAVPYSVRDPLPVALSEMKRLQVSVFVSDPLGGDSTLTVVEWPQLLTPDYPHQVNVMWALEYPAILIRTSGSGGISKFALLSLGNLYFSALGVLSRIDLDSNDRWFVSVPLFHVSGLGILMRAFIATAAIVLPDPNNTLLGNAAHFSASHLSLVPTQLQRLLEDSAFYTMAFQFKAMMLSGAEIHADLISRARAAGLPLITGYGLTETSSAVTLGTPDPIPGDSGKPLPFREIKLNDDGEILVRGKTLFLGYWVDGDLVVLPLTADGWFQTGDLGQWAGDHLLVTGRKNDMLISGGENIHPVEIETAIREVFHPRRVLVKGIPDREFGQRPIAYIDPLVPIREFRHRLAEHLPHFKIPDAVLPWPIEWESKMKLLRKNR